MSLLTQHPIVASLTVVALVKVLSLLTNSPGQTWARVLPWWCDISQWSRWGLAGTVLQLAVTAAGAGGAVLVAAIQSGVTPEAWPWESAGHAVLAALGIVTGVKQLSPARAARKRLEHELHDAEEKVAAAQSRLEQTLPGALLLTLMLSGCAGSLEEAKLAGLDPQARSAAAEPSARCQKLDNEQRYLGGASKGLAFLGGASGIATWPVENRDAEVGLAIGAGVAAAGALVTEYVADGARESWAREGCGQ